MSTELPKWAINLAAENRSFRDLLREAKARGCLTESLTALEKRGIAMDDFGVEPTPRWREVAARFWVHRWFFFPSLATLSRLAAFWFSIVTGILTGGTLLNVITGKEAQGWLNFLIILLLFAASIQLHRALTWIKERGMSLSVGDTTSFEGIVEARRHGLLSHKKAQKEMVRLYWRYFNLM